MPEGLRLTVRLSPALEARLSDRVRQGGSVSDIVREALAAYLGVGPTARQTERQTPAVPAADTVSAVSDRLSAIASDMADMRARLTALEAQIAARTSSRRRRQTTRQTRVADTPKGPPQAFDPLKYRLGKLCKAGHDWQGTGQSVRVKNKAGYCLACNAEAARARRHATRQASPPP